MNMLMVLISFLMFHFDFQNYSLPVDLLCTSICTFFSSLQDAILDLLQKKHQDEWNILIQMMNSNKFKEIRKSVTMETQQQRSDRLAALHSERQKFELGS